MTYVPVLSPYLHQTEARDKMRGRMAFALLMEMRTGKTKVVLDDWGEMEDAREVRDLLLVAPAGALYGEDALETQVPQHMPAELRERAMVYVWRSGAGKAAQAELDRMLRSTDPRRPRVLLVNVEALSTVKRAREASLALLSAGSAVMVVDESTKIKGKSERTQQVVEMGRLARYRRIMSGLVAPHSPMDLYHQFEFLDPRILRQRSWFGFRARYAITRRVCFLPAEKRAQLEAEGRHLPMTEVVVAYRGQDELASLIEPHSYRKLLKDCYDAPPPRYQFRDVELTDEQARMYREMREYATTRIEGESHATALMAMTQIMRLHQLVCGYMVDDEGGGRHPVPERRTAAVLDLLRECQGRAVVWCAYDWCIRHVLAAIRREFDEPGTPPERSVAVAFWGGNRGEREEGERRFKADPACRYMVATAAAGGMGRKWAHANLMVYHSNTPDLEHRYQSEMRDQAVGKVDPVTRVDVRVPGTVDDRIIHNLRNKIDSAATLQGDGYREWLI